MTPLLAPQVPAAVFSSLLTLSAVAPPLLVASVDSCLTQHCLLLREGFVGFFCVVDEVMAVYSDCTV